MRDSMQSPCRAAACCKSRGIEIAPLESPEDLTAKSEEVYDLPLAWHFPFCRPWFCRKLLLHHVRDCFRRTGPDVTGRFPVGHAGEELFFHAIQRPRPDKQR